MARTGGREGLRGESERWRRSTRVAIGVYALVLGVGVAAWALTPTPTPWTPALGSTAAESSGQAGRVNWAVYVLGTQVRVSAWDRFRSHHPLFLIDGQRRPTPREKWATLPGADAAWLELSFTEPRPIDRVVLKHATWREPELGPYARYRITCHRADVTVAALDVTDNREPVAHHAIDCPATDRLRVDFESGGPSDRVRLYEVEAWGSESGDAG